MSTVTDTEAENRRLRELEEAVRERDQLHQMVDIPLSATNRDVENGDEKVRAMHDDLPSSDACKCGIGDVCKVFGALLLIGVGKAVIIVVFTRQ
jgi:hypothetical protein